MKAGPENTNRRRGVVLSREGAVGGAASRVKVPGFGEVTVVDGRTIASAKDAAGRRLRTIIMSGDWKPAE